MRRVAGYRTRFTVLAVIGLGVGAHAAGAWLTTWIDAVLARGPESHLPVHMAVVLGVTAVERPTAVKQAVMRDGTTVRTFNVCTDDHDKVVLINYNEQTKASKAYFVSPSGELHKAIAFSAGGPAIERPSDEARGDLDAELAFWRGLERHPAGAK